MRGSILKAGLLVLALAGIAAAGPGGPPAGAPILNQTQYQKGSSAWIDTMTVQGIMGLPYGITPPPSFECNAATHTGRIFISTSITPGMARIYVCEGVNGWQVKSSTGGSGGGGVPGGSANQYQYNNAGSFAGSVNLVDNGSSVTATAVNMSTVIVTNYAQFQNVSTMTWQSVSTITFADGILIDMSQMKNSNLSTGLVLPQNTNCSNATRNGQICWDNDDHILWMGNGTAIQPPFTIGSANLGVSNGPVLVTTPTALINLDPTQFIATAVNTTTATVVMNSSTVTLQGNTFNGLNQLVKTNGVGNIAVNGVSISTSIYQTFPDFHILQMQYYHTETSSNTIKTSFQDTTLKGSFTPKLATSKVFLIATGLLSQNVGDGGFVTLARSGVNLAPGGGGFMGTVSNNNYNLSIVYLDSPGSTSAVTYSVQFRTAGGGATIVFPVTNGGLVPSAGLLAVEIAQ